MFYRDLEPYRYGVQTELKDVVTVGWLSKVSSYPQGHPTAELVGALERLLSSHRVHQTRGYHACEFCSKSPLAYGCTKLQQLAYETQLHETQSGKKVLLGSAEIWVPALGQTVIYAAPDLIYHYVKEHRYLPPAEFIDVVLSARDSRDWDANTECEKRLEAGFRT